MYTGPYQRRGVFRPRNLSTLQPQFQTLIGRVFDFEFVGTSEDDESYPGQTRWIISCLHDDELTEEQRGRWMPEEDIEWSQPKPSKE
jgi:hypothetical protein